MEYRGSCRPTEQVGFDGAELAAAVVIESGDPTELAIAFEHRNDDELLNLGELP